MATSRLRTRIRLALVVFWLTVTAWLLLNMQARGVDPSVLRSSPQVNVSMSSAALTFTPTTDTARVGVLFYPGALADPAAYAPMARALAEAGYAAVILELPFRLAPLARHRAQLTQRTRTLIREEGTQRAWVIGGHSKGGKLAAQFARDHTSEVAGLLLIGTSHPREDDLSALALDVAKVYGSADGLASEEEIHHFGPNLPATTHWTRIEGGNHAQFGWYGWQLGDGRATISRAEQQALTVRAVLDQLQRVEEALR
ncbi:MAG: alpha/beta family hydrolase [Bacteroidota bacterium]